MTLLAIVFVALLLAATAFWVLATRAQSVATLDRIDGFFTSGETELAAGPVAFGPHPQQKLFVHRVPVFEPGESRPVLVFIHGGSWRTGDPKPYAYVARNLAPEGYIVVLAGYRLGEEGRFPGMLQDGAAAIRWVHDNIADFGGDPARIAVMGHSAGAYNAAMLALDTRWLEAQDLPPDTIDAVVGLAGPYDFLPLDSDSTRAAFGHVDSLESTQPVRFARSDAPPVLLMTGDTDETVKPRNTSALARALRDTNMPENRIRTVLIPGMGHIGIVMALSRPFEKDGSIKRTIVTFLADSLAPDGVEPAPSASADIQP